MLYIYIHIHSICRFPEIGVPHLSSMKQTTSGELEFFPWKPYLQEPDHDCTPLLENHV